jgi:DNA-binding NtrC family response regulator
VQTDVRLIASTNQDLESAIRDKTFREDLYYRLNVLSITLPPLRERSEDIPLLAAYFFRKACREMGVPEKEIDPEVLHWMSGNPWPGNVRELQNFVRRMTVFSTAERVDMGLVRQVCQGSDPAAAPGPCAHAPASALGEYKTAKAEAVAAFTEAYIHDLLTQTRGNVSEAARVSGLSRPALQKILSRMGETAASFRDRD